MMETDLWVVLQTAALVTAAFGVWILARACWDYAGVPAVRDAYLELVAARMQELGWGTVPAERSSGGHGNPADGAENPAGAGAGAGAEAGAGVLGGRGRGFARAAWPVRSTAARGGTVPGGRKLRGGPAAPAGGRPVRRRDAEFLRRTRRALLSRPLESERAASQTALLQLISRPALSPAQRIPAADLLPELAQTVAAANTLQDLARTERLQGAAVRRLLRREAPRRFRAVFLPGMARYLDFVGRGSSLGLALGVLLGGGLTGNADLVGALTAVCGVAGAIFFTLTVIRCESRSWPVGESGVWLRLARRYPQVYFLLRLTLTTVVVLFALHLVQG